MFAVVHSCVDLFLFQSKTFVLLAGVPLLKSVWPMAFTLAGRLNGELAHSSPFTELTACEWPAFCWLAATADCTTNSVQVEQVVAFRHDCWRLIALSLVLHPLTSGLLGVLFHCSAR